MSLALDELRLALLLEEPLAALDLLDDKLKQCLIRTSCLSTDTLSPSFSSRFSYPWSVPPRTAPRTFLMEIDPFVAGFGGALEM